jgi:hypothetical protein
MELALLAEGMHEMLMKGYGDAIARALLSDRCDVTSVVSFGVILLWRLVSGFPQLLARRLAYACMSCHEV